MDRAIRKAGDAVMMMVVMTFGVLFAVSGIAMFILAIQGK